ncbi:MAG: tetrahydromethanopterin S-methyltransferase subunit B [Methanobacteriaceae archaeon]|jgi:tetrahydromethanopterin S-methyltransferase subunit B|uniref:tetrahydromethanopterin S-methyltransferase subunit MtrB n=1 Tax=Methanobrevibacter TaxID=2172 RepID=UPI0037604B00|nr:tetrahydromethanopterin S-methyltransferase subunit B [Methanobacteriaceae archaeon]MDD4594108.1 tetrahydromethanopterin S-methyltransferase subunit B [Methanobacteriaceae archaeon]
MEMLPLIQVVPEMDLAIDPVTGSIGGAIGGGVLVTLDDVNVEIDKIEEAADELINSLDPTTAPVGAYAGRAGSYVTAGKQTNFVYGFLIGLLLLVAILPILAKMGVL